MSKVPQYMNKLREERKEVCVVVDWFQTYVFVTINCYSEVLQEESHSNCVSGVASTYMTDFHPF